MNLKDVSERLHHDVGLGTALRVKRERAGAISSNSIADASWPDRSIDCATRAKLWDRFVDPVVGRWETGREYSAQSTLRRRAFRRATYGHRARVAKYTIAPAHDDCGRDQTRQSLHFYRNVGRRPIGFAAIGLLQPDYESEQIATQSKN